MIVNAVDLLSGDEIAIDKGALAEAVTASCAIPGILTPVKKDNYLLVDGGMLDNLPATLISKKEVDHIISVNVDTRQQKKRLQMLT